MLRPVRALRTWDICFVDAIDIDEKKSKNADASNFSKRYPYHEPMNPSLGGFDGTFESLVFCIGVGIKKEADHDCLLRCGGAFVWTIRTLEKLGTCRGKRMRFLLQMMEFFYSISMGRDAIWDAVPFSQYLGVLGSA